MPDLLTPTWPETLWSGFCLLSMLAGLFFLVRFLIRRSFPKRNILRVLLIGAVMVTGQGRDGGKD